jgi:hypothetical protein
MSEEQNERNPLVSLKDLRPEDKIKMKLDCAKAVKTGETKYGTWYLWFVFVENARVREGRGTSQQIKDNYTGKAIFFPSEKLNEDLEKATDGNLEVEVEITKKEEKTSTRTITKYVVSKLTMGKKGESSLKPTESMLLKEAKELKEDGYEFTEDLFLKASKEPQYGGKITEERARELYKLL